VTQTGMMLENNLAVQTEPRPAEIGFVNSDPLKTSLGKLSEVLAQTLKDAVKPDSPTTAKLQNLASLTADVLKNLPSVLSKKDADALVNLFNHLASFPKTKTLPSTVRDVVTQTGLIVEKNLAALSGRSSGQSVSMSVDNIKASLLKLSEALSQALQNAGKTGFSGNRRTSKSVFIYDRRHKDHRNGTGGQCRLSAK
jgi:hypothetical protein